jgi:hypothetical protein
MFVQDVLNLARLRLDDVVKDAKGNYLWSDDELLVYYNESEHELARKSRCLYDASTAAVCTYDIFPGLPTLDINNLIVEINASYLSSNGKTLGMRSVKYFGAYNWRSGLGLPQLIIPNYEPHVIRFYPYYSTTYQGVSYIIQGISDISFNSSGTIARPSGGLLTMFPSGTKMLVSGTTSNNVALTSAGGTETLLNVTGTVVTESNTSALLTKKIDTLNLEVARLPLVNVAIANVATASPEVDDDYHVNLADGILARAYLKRDSETYDLQEAAKFRAIWDSFIEDVRNDQIVIGEDEQVFNAHYGSI